MYKVHRKSDFPTAARAALYSQLLMPLITARCILFAQEKRVRKLVVSGNKHMVITREMAAGRKSAFLVGAINLPLENSDAEQPRRILSLAPSSAHRRALHFRRMHRLSHDKSRSMHSRIQLHDFLEFIPGQPPAPAPFQLRFKVTCRRASVTFRQTIRRCDRGRGRFAVPRRIYKSFRVLIL